MEYNLCYFIDIKKRKYKSWKDSFSNAIKENSQLNNLFEISPYNSKIRRAICKIYSIKINYLHLHRVNGPAVVNTWPMFCHETIRAYNIGHSIKIYL